MTEAEEVSPSGPLTLCRLVKEAAEAMPDNARKSVAMGSTSASALMRMPPPPVDRLVPAGEASVGGSADPIAANYGRRGRGAGTGRRATHEPEPCLVTMSDSARRRL